jgi:DNA-binding phage protein
MTMSVSARNPKTNRRGETTDEAHARIAEEHPATTTGEWAKTCSLDKVLRLVGDLCGVPTEVAGDSARTGTRFLAGAGVDPRDTMVDLFGDVGRRMAQIYDGVDPEWSTLEFQLAFRFLAGDRSLTQLARRTGLNRYRVHRLLNGVYPPTTEEMSMIALSFKRNPRYFKEYRSAMIAKVVHDAMDDNPDHSSVIARQMSR